MCDYSLHANPTRLAVENEDLIAYRFPAGSIGLASLEELRSRRTMKKPAPPRWTLAWWKSEWWKSWFREPDDDAPACAVCIPPGAKLLLSELPLPLQRELGVSANETVRFVQMDADEYSYRDAVRFSNGRRILLQALRPGQAVRVLSLACEEREARSGALSSNTLVEAR